MKELKDYLHLYYGCMVAKFDRNGERYHDIINHAWLLQAFEDLKKGGKHYYQYKILLRPLSDMTEKEKNICDEILDAFNPDNYLEACQGMGNITLHLTKSGFDLFGLIEAGLAIDKTTLK